MGLKNPGTASTRFGQIKRKLAEKFGGSIPATPTSSKNADMTKTPDSGKKGPKDNAGKKRKALDDDTPSKKRPAKQAKPGKEEPSLKKTEVEMKDGVTIKEEAVDDGGLSEFVILYPYFTT